MVGISGLVIDFSLTFFMKEMLKVNKYIANSAGFLTAASTNYILNRIWTFQSGDPKIFIQFTKFFIISLIGLILNNTILYFLHRNNRMNFYFAKVIAIILVTLWNFLANFLYTFSNVT
jgi:putative flippase GtrA